MGWPYNLLGWQLTLWDDPITLWDHYQGWKIAFFGRFTAFYVTARRFMTCKPFVMTPMSIYCQDQKMEPGFVKKFQPQLSSIAFFPSFSSIYALITLKSWIFFAQPCSPKNSASVEPKHEFLAYIFPEILPYKCLAVMRLPLVFSHRNTINIPIELPFLKLETRD